MISEQVELLSNPSKMKKKNTENELKNWKMLEIKIFVSYIYHSVQSVHIFVNDLTSTIIFSKSSVKLLTLS